MFTKAFDCSIYLSKGTAISKAFIKFIKHVNVTIL